MRDFAKAFYLSKEWRRARAYVFNRDAGLCVRCGALGEIVHHKEHLTPQNISNPEIALGEDNLELLCRNCHALAHAGELATDSGLTFDDEGNVVKRELLSSLLPFSARTRKSSTRRSGQLWNFSPLWAYD